MTTALQVTDFDFYGDSLIALKDNATGEIYTAITQVLRGIGFSERQVEYQRNKMLKDTVVSKGVQKFLGVDLELPSVDEIYCISNRKLPIALTKITITPKMKRDQPELSQKLELYQDKCADVLAAVFIDNSNTSYNKYQLFIDAMSNFANTISSIQQDVSYLKEQQNKLSLPKKTFSRWSSRMFPKYQLLMDYFDISRSELYHNLYIELENQHTDIDLKQLQEDYCLENGLNNCFTLDAIEHNKSVRGLFETLVNNLLSKYHIIDPSTISYICPTIFNV